MLALEGTRQSTFRALWSNDLARVEHTGHNRYQSSDLARGRSGERTGTRRLAFARFTNWHDSENPQDAAGLPSQRHSVHPAPGSRNLCFLAPEYQSGSSIFCISNVTDEEKSICLADINLISIDQWRDLISGEHYRDIGKQLKLLPIRQCGLATRIPMKILSLRRRTRLV